MEELDNSRFATVFLFITSCLSFFNIGFHFTGTGPLVPAIQAVYNNTYMKRYGDPLPQDVWYILLTLTISIILVGGFTGACCNKFLLHFFSRKRLVQLCHLLNLVGVVIICLVGGLTGSYEAVIVGRFLVGIPLGVFYTLLPMFNAEVSVRSKHPVWQSATAISIVIGTFIGPAVAHPKGLGTPQLWPVAISFVSLPSIVYLIASFLFPETPYYLIRAGKVEEALELLRKLRMGTMDNVKAEMTSIEEEINKSLSVLSLKEILSTKQYRRIFFCVAAIFAGFMLSGANHFFFYTDFVFLQAGVDPDTVTFASLGVFALEAILCLPAFKVINMYGGRNVLIGSTVVIMFSAVLFTISQITNHLAPSAMPIVAIISTALIISAFGAFMNTAILVVLSDITTEPIRPTAFSLGSMLLWIISWIVAFLPPYLQEALGPYAVSIWIGCTVFFLIFQITCLPETKGKTTDEIQEYFK